MLISPQLLNAIADQAAQADQTRSLDPSVVDGLRACPVMGMTASPELGGLDSSVVAVAGELQRLASACTSTAWCLWNHLSTFHLFCGLLGPNNRDWLRDIVGAAEWVCFPAGASTAVRASAVGETLTLAGTAAFGSGARYAQWAGVSFVQGDRSSPQFTMVDLRQPQVRIDPTWRAMSLRASATDHVHYEAAVVDASRVVPFPLRYRVTFRQADHEVIHPRYREDWVGLSNLWLGAMAVGLVSTSLAAASSGIKERIAIMGVKMVERPTVHLNLGQAQTALTAASDTVLNACQQTDGRIADQQTPTEANYLEQIGASARALALCEEAMTLITRVLGGNGLREGDDFERRLRDFHAMPLHINAHRDRVNEQIGRHLLGLETTNPF